MALQSNENNNSGGPNRTSNEGRKEASGGSIEPQHSTSNGGEGKGTSNTSRGGGSSRSKVTKGAEDGSAKKAPARRK